MAQTLSAIRPAAPTRIKYEKRLRALIDEMAASLDYWIAAAWRARPPNTIALPAATPIAQDDSPSRTIANEFDTLASRWLARFAKLAPQIAGWFGKAHKSRVDAAMQADLRKAGFTVKFTMTAPMRDAYNAVIDENIGLISSLAERHLGAVRQGLMQSVAQGGDLAGLSKILQKQAGISKRRAARIARDQNQKATATMARQRALQLGITKAHWMHSAGGKEPRPEHVAFNGKVYDVAAGHDFGNGEGVVWPGTAINCRCVALPIVPGFDD